MDGVGTTSQFNWPIFVLAVIYAMAFAGGAGILCYRQSKKSFEPITGLPPLLNQNLNGLGGWLILPCFGLIVGPIRLVATMGKSMSAFSLWKWHALTTSGSPSYNPLWEPLLTFELLGQISILILDIFVLVLFFQKHRLFPRWFIVFLILNAVFVLGDMTGMHFLGISSPESAGRHLQNIMGVVFGCGIWIPYMCVSERVKATFVR